ncbi:serine hydrolase domain-containing protein [Spongiactinospora sp. TRM90649]|uniref:serine hydrolase domain-containing protein n=1 Tax=Spongiactinospora sp. TRM90649 TaxID=3031114 RepID=UPI0023F88E22|nr:serine hydrolase domain-containing protein [Spongiactinospora sp. TRM90649]MDF5754093.1 serine hydrolase [Spongiactinospora sp. TRM90649]
MTARFRRFTATPRRAAAPVAAALALVLVPGGGAALAAVTPTAGPDGVLRRDADAAIKLGVTGLQLRVTTADGKGTVLARGVADVKSKRPAPRDGYFRIGSVNKSFVATVVLQLVGEGKLRLTDSVERHLPGVVKGNGNDGRKITIRQLLQHTSGIVDDYPFPNAADSSKEFYRHRFDISTPQQVVRRAMRHKPLFAPGKAWAYSNTGYALLGMVIRATTGNDWSVEVKRRIIDPLGLKHTSSPGTSAKLPRPHARGYEQFGGEKRLVDVTEQRDADASGGIISTTDDLERFLRALLGGRLLKSDLLTQMKRGVLVNAETRRFWPGARYGLGLWYRPLPCGDGYWGHGGDIFGYMTRAGIAEKSGRAAVLSLSSQLRSSKDQLLGEDRAATKLMDDALCGKK